MKLSEIVIQEDAPPGDKEIELKELVKYFPNNYARAARTLANSGRLTFGGELVYTKDGRHGPALERAISEAETVCKEDKINLSIEMDGTIAGKDEHDEHDEFDFDAEVHDVQFEYVGYSITDDQLILGFDAWVNEDEFNNEWDKHFEETFGEDFDNDDPAHEKIFDKAWKRFRDNQMFFGLMVEVSSDFHASMDNMPRSHGWHRGFAPDPEPDNPIGHMTDDAEIKKKLLARGGKIKKQFKVIAGAKVIDL